MTLFAVFKLLCQKYQISCQSLLLFIQAMQTNPYRVAYFHNEEIGKFYYCRDHPMKPKRISMTHSLVESFDLYKQLDVYRARQCTKEEFMKFHHPDYINYLQNYVSKDTLKTIGLPAHIGCTLPPSAFEQDRRDSLSNIKKKNMFHLGENGDCPAFSGLYEYCQYSCGGSIEAAHVLLSGDADVSINWGGGMHHAKKCEASGFCYTNDIVLSILQLMQWYPRVLYLDIDVHHGDGVEEAFYLTNRCMTVSFHQYGEDFFPGTGGLDSIGQGPGKYYSLNVPLKPGMDDETYYSLFVEIMDAVMAKYRPGAVVVQLGADSIAYDKLGNFNMTIRGHGRCLQKMLGYGVPTVMLGGGGYTVQNVARCWAYETGVAVGQKIEGAIPKTDQFYESYLPEQKLHLNVKPVENKNTPEYLNELRKRIHLNISMMEAAPGVQIHNVPNSAAMMEEEFEEDKEIDEEDSKVEKYLRTLITKRDRIII